MITLKRLTPFLPVIFILIAAVALGGVYMIIIPHWSLLVIALFLASIAWFTYQVIVKLKNPKSFQLIHERHIVEQESRRLQEAMAERDQQLSQQMQSVQRKMVRLHTLKIFSEQEDFTQKDQVANSQIKKQQQAVQKFLNEESEKIFTNILEKRYQSGEQFDTARISHDLLELIQGIAQIYKPESKNPLLETDIETLLRSIHNISFHLLTLLENLPLDIKRYNIHKTYEMVQTGTKAYGYYQRAAPFLPYARYASYIGRLAAGAAPAVLGAWWAAGQAIQYGVKQVSSRFAKRYALDFFQDLISIVGLETAEIYAPGFRFRHPDWHLGVEFTHLHHQLALPEPSLSKLLQHLSRLRLSNEYDRLYLYFCISEKESASPERLNSVDILTEEECQEIYQALRKFVKKESNMLSEKEVNQWQGELEQRLMVI
ncbi:hypothetical protein ACQZV8_09475 [Magnetococcales bacterium HHB-1]